MNYTIKTFGCQMNFSDSDRIKTFMQENGFTPLTNADTTLTPAEKLLKADLVIFNTCGVRASSEHRVFGQINNLTKLAKKKDKDIKIIVTGCSAHRKDFQKTIKDKVTLFTSIKDFPQSFRKLNLLQKEQQEYEDYLAIQPELTDTVSAVVPIMTGCNNFCSYCVVPYARGREWSRPVDEIINEIKNLNIKQYTEVTLLGQNVNSYNFKKDTLANKTEFPELLQILATKFPKINFKFLTSHPKDLSDALIMVIKNNLNIPNEIHLPFQAGSDKVLKDMNRPYTQEKYLNVVKKIKNEIPDVQITTDVIIGFPTETDADFLETVKIFKLVGFSKAFLNKYSPRPETPAFKLGDPIQWDVKKKREQMLREILGM